MTAACSGVRNRVLTYRHVSAVCSEPNDARSVLERPRLARRGRCEGLKAQSAQHWIQVPKDARSLIEVAVNVHVSQLRGVHLQEGVEGGTVVQRVESRDGERRQERKAVTEHRLQARRVRLAHSK